MLLALLILSLILSVVDANTHLLQPIRSALATYTARPVYFIADLPYRLSSGARENLSSRESLIEENRQLKRRILELSQVSEQFIALRQENIRLRDLLGSRERLDTEVLIAELVGIVPGSDTLQVMIDKGSTAGVYVGQAVIDAKGLFGQVVETGKYAARVLMITDANHAVPVEVNRNGVRAVAAGTGRIEELDIEHVPVTADIREGDLLVSSGLGGRFPRGYPVGKVVSRQLDPGEPFARVLARPLAELDRSRYVLLVFSPTDNSQGEMQTPSEAPEVPEVPEGDDAS